jgi:predicted restriction endonuclease
VHHIRALSQGGTDDLENLTHLCSFHHELVHQLSFAMDGGINWVRSPEVRYEALGKRVVI